MEKKQKLFLHTFTFVVLILGIFRFCSDSETAQNTDCGDSIIAHLNSSDSIQADNNTTGTPAIPHPILSVPNYDKAFPDDNPTQLVAAKKWGVQPVADRKDAEARKNELVYIGFNPYFHTDRMTSSIPYLIPRASILLQDIGRAFFDSLHVKGIPMHKIIVTSVLRTKDDVEKLRLHNPNATENSCHMFGTTVDIAQNRFVTIEDPDGPRRRAVTNDTLKWILTEVLRDMRESNRCYVKYERNQGCFHLTVR